MAEQNIAGRAASRFDADVVIVPMIMLLGNAIVWGAILTKSVAPTPERVSMLWMMAGLGVFAIGLVVFNHKRRRR